MYEDIDWYIVARSLNDNWSKSRRTTNLSLEDTDSGRYLSIPEYGLEMASGITTAALKTDTPVIFGILTTVSIEQAVERSGAKAGNKGCEAALAALEMVSLLHQCEQHEWSFV